MSGKQASSVVNHNTTIQGQSWEEFWVLEMAYGNAASVEIHKRRGFPRAAWKSYDKKRRNFSTFPQALLGFFPAFKKRKNQAASALDLIPSQDCSVDREPTETGGIRLWPSGRSSILGHPEGRFFRARPSNGPTRGPSRILTLRRVIFCLPNYWGTPQLLREQDNRPPSGICLRRGLKKHNNQTRGEPYE